nr:MAG TPA: hypothetical protein [Bacteriophage sp.]
MVLYIYIYIIIYINIYIYIRFSDSKPVVSEKHNQWFVFQKTNGIPLCDVQLIRIFKGFFAFLHHSIQFKRQASQNRHDNCHQCRNDVFKYRMFFRFLSPLS